MEPNRQILTRPVSYSLQQLYDQYAGMLLGYLHAIVNDHQVAEQHLINIFKDLPKHLPAINTAGVNAWCELQKLAKKELSDVVPRGTDQHKAAAQVIRNYEVRNKFLSLMTEEQKQVFCLVYYQRKSTLELSKELNISEELVRKLLKQAFAIIKKAA